MNLLLTGQSQKVDCSFLLYIYIYVCIYICVYIYKYIWFKKNNSKPMLLGMCLMLGGVRGKGLYNI